MVRSEENEYNKVFEVSKCVYFRLFRLAIRRELLRIGST